MPSNRALFAAPIGHRQFFLTQQQKSDQQTPCKRKKTADDTQYFKEKAALVKAENERRQQLHDVMMKKQQTELSFIQFWQEQLRARASEMSIDQLVAVGTLLVQPKAQIGEIIDLPNVQVSTSTSTNTTNLLNWNHLNNSEVIYVQESPANSESLPLKSTLNSNKRNVTPNNAEIEIDEIEYEELVGEDDEDNSPSTTVVALNIEKYDATVPQKILQ